MNKCQTEAEPNKVPPPDLEVGVFIAVIILMLVTFASLPWIGKIIATLGGDPQVTALGAVQRVSFVGGYQARTQVEVAGRTLLLRGAMELDRDTRVERRTNRMTDQLCVAGTDRCHDIVSH